MRKSSIKFESNLSFEFLNQIEVKLGSVLTRFDYTPNNKQLKLLTSFFNIILFKKMQITNFFVCTSWELFVNFVLKECDYLYIYILKIF